MPRCTPQSKRLALARGGSHWIALRRRERDEKAGRTCRCGEFATLGRRGVFAIDGSGRSHALHACTPRAPYAGPHLGRSA